MKKVLLVLALAFTLVAAVILTAATATSNGDVKIALATVFTDK